MADAKVKIDEGGVDPKEAGKIEKSVKGLDQAPTVAQQTPTRQCMDRDARCARPAV